MKSALRGKETVLDVASRYSHDLREARRGDVGYLIRRTFRDQRGPLLLATAIGLIGAGIGLCLSRRAHRE